MIRRLRTRHRWTAIVLWLLLPAAYGVGLVVRPEDPVGQVSAAVRPELGGLSYEDGWRFVQLENGSELAMRSIESAQGFVTHVELQPETDLKRPDVLVYWSREAAIGAAGLPGDAVLLGSLAGTERRRYPLPSGVAWGEGALVLYSLGHQELLSVTFLAAKIADPPAEGED